MPRSLPACTSSRVMLTSSGLGVGSPEGWLWEMMMLGAFSITAVDYGGAEHLGGTHHRAV